MSSSSSASILSAPLYLWDLYITYLWNYKPGTWVYRIAQTSWILAFMVITPFIILTLLVCHLSFQRLLPELPLLNTDCIFRGAAASLLVPFMIVGCCVVRDSADEFRSVVERQTALTPIVILNLDDFGSRAFRLRALLSNCSAYVSDGQQLHTKIPSLLRAISSGESFFAFCNFARRDRASAA